MKLPKAVQDAKDRSEQADAAARAAATPPPQDEPPGDPPPQAPQDPPQGDPETKREDWKAKYSTLQGMYNAEVPRLHRELKAANARVEELLAEVATLKATVAAATKPVAPPAPAAPTVPDALVQALGADAAEAIARIVADNAQAVRDDVGKELDPLKEKLDTSTKTADQLAADRARDAQAQFLSTLTTRVPDWQAIDAREDWQVYLNERDVIARRPRGELLKDAAQAGDIDAVTAIFDAFKKHAGLVKDPPPAAPPVNPAAHLEAPPISGRAAAPVVEKKIWTRKEIETFYADVTKGVYPRQRAQELGRDIEAAAREGRIR
jgi:hypothetical protein